MSYLNNIKQNAIDKDSFTIVKDYVRIMEEYDDFYLRSKTMPKYNSLMRELQILSEHYLQYEGLKGNEILIDPHNNEVRPMYISEMILDEIKHQKEREENEISWEFDSDSEMEGYYYDRYDEDEEEETDFQNTILTGYEQYY